MSQSWVHSRKKHGKINCPHLHSIPKNCSHPTLFLWIFLNLHPIPIISSPSPQNFSQLYPHPHNLRYHHAVLVKHRMGLPTICNSQTSGKTKPIMEYSSFGSCEVRLHNVNCSVHCFILHLLKDLNNGNIIPTTVLPPQW